MDIPYTSFTGVVCQLETQFPIAEMKTSYDLCFSLFDEIDRARANDLGDGITTTVTAAGTEFNFGSRPRRFAGGPGLQPGSYFTLASGVGDDGALRDELTAYYSGSAGISALIYDPTVDEWLTEHLEAMGVSHSDSPLLYIVYGIEAPISPRTLATIRDSDSSFDIGEKIGITYGVRRSEISLRNVIDLRHPEVQEWFVHTFVSLEDRAPCRPGAVVHLKIGPPPASFGEMIPVISSLETGGGMVFNQAVGAWLRTHGADGLIFPGARSNCCNRVHDGRVESSSGWNLVRYVDATPPVNANLFGLMGTWRDSDHDHLRVQHTATGLQRGSFSIRGAREFNLIDFELKRRHACGIRDDTDLAARATGSRNALISQTVNRMLEAESINGDIYEQEANYISILDFLEKRWNPQ